jgi:ankyrin repeat protein
MPDYSHDFLTEHVRQSTELKLSRSGICAGFSAASKLYFLSGKVEYGIFKQIDEYLADKDPIVLRQEINQFKKRKAESKDYTPSKEEAMLEELDIFLDIIFTFSEPKLLKDKIGKHISQSKTSEILDYIKRKYHPRFDQVTQMDSFPIMLEKDEKDSECEKFLKKMTEEAKKDPPCRVSFAFESLRHRIELHYDGQEKQWYMGDANQRLEIKQSIPEEEIIDSLFSAIEERSHAEVIGFTLSPSTNGDSKRFNSYFENVQAISMDSMYFANGDIRMTPNCVTLSHLAARSGHLEILKNLKEKSSLGIAAINSFGTPLIMAADQVQIEAVRILINDVVDSEKIELFFHAVKANYDADVISLFLEKANEVQDDNKWQPIHHAAKTTNVDALKILLEAKSPADITAETVEKCTPLRLAIGDSDERMAEAAFSSQLMTLLTLQEQLTLPVQNSSGMRIDEIFQSIEQDREDAVSYLLQKLQEQKPSEMSRILNQVIEGDTALTQAAKSNNTNIVKLLTNSGADLEHKNEDGQRAIHIAAENGNVDILKALLEAKPRADIAAKDKDEQQAIHIAAKNGNVDVLKALLEAKPSADISAQDKIGCTPLLFAIHGGHQPAIELLLQRLSEQKSFDEIADIFQAIYRKGEFISKGERIVPEELHLEHRVTIYEIKKAIRKQYDKYEKVNQILQENYLNLDTITSQDFKEQKRDKPFEKPDENVIKLFIACNDYLNNPYEEDLFNECSEQIKVICEVAEYCPSDHHLFRTSLPNIIANTMRNILSSRIGDYFGIPTEESQLQMSA